MEAADPTPHSLELMTTREKTLVVVCLGVNTILLNMCRSVIAPVFPIEARLIHPRHDAKAGVAIGFVFSIATITNFLSAPLIGREMPQLGAKRTIGLGAFFVGCLMFLFSFVSQLYDWTTFLVFCYAIRMCQGFGMAMIFVSTFGLIASTFPENVASMMGVWQMFSGFGFMAGPAVGGVLYQYGGFKVPFMTFGGMLLLGMVAIQFVLPETTTSVKKDGSFPSTTILRQPRAAMMLIVVFLTSTGVSFFDPSFGIFLHEGFHLSPAQVGAVFLIASGIYMLMSPLSGRLADKYGSEVIIPLGCFIIAIGFELLGPHMLFGIKKHIGMALAGYAMVGTGVGVSSIPASAEILKTMKKKGYADTPKLHSAVGGLFGAALSAGYTAGPLLGGSLTGHFSFGDATALLGFIFFAIGIIVTAQTFGQRFFQNCCKKPSGHPSDMTPLTNTVASK